MAQISRHQFVLEVLEDELSIGNVPSDKADPILHADLASDAENQERLVLKQAREEAA